MDSPKKKQNTSQVIDSLHSTIDSLKSDLDSITISSNDYKKKYEAVSKKNDSIVDQLANVKHENDMINALLKRKERRIFDLENQFNELSSSNETLQLNNKNLKIRCENLNESSASSIAEFERLKISYDALISSQKEYKKHYQQELTTISNNFEQFKLDNIAKWESLSAKLTNDDKDFDTLLESLTNKRKTMDNIYVNKNKAILELLAKLAKLTKIHGQESKNVLQENTNIVQDLVAKTPDLQDKLLKFEKVEIDLDQLLNDSQDTLSNCSFDDESTVVSVPDDVDLKINVETKDLPSRSNSMQTKRRKNKRNSMRFDSKSGPDFSNINTPTSNPISLPKRPNNINNRLLSSHRTPTPPTEIERNFSNSSQNSNNYQNQNQNQNHQTMNHYNHNVNQNGYNNYNKSHNYNNNYNSNSAPNHNNNYSSNNYSNSGYTVSSGYNNNYNQAMNTNQNQSGGINTNANNFNKFNHLSNNYKHHRNSSYNPTSQNNQNQQSQQAKQAKRRSYSNYNANNGVNTNKRNSQILDSTIDYGNAP